MTWLSALSIGFAADVFVAIGVILFAYADKRYQVEKLARLQAEGLYRPEWTLPDLVSGPVLDALPELPPC